MVSKNTDRGSVFGDEVDPEHEDGIWYKRCINNPGFMYSLDLDKVKTYPRYSNWCARNEEEAHLAWAKYLIEKGE